jgi:hypothetical protein
MKKQVFSFHFHLSLLLSFFSLASTPLSTWAHNPNDEINNSRARLSDGTTISEESERIETPRFTLYYPRNKSSSETSPTKISLKDFTLSVLDETYSEFGKILKVQPQDRVTIRFLTPEQFRIRTGAPSWTSAMYLRGEISIPLDRKATGNLAELRRAIRHEYTHAVIAEKSAKKCPAWIDEGLAQIFEEDVNPLLAPALRKWIGGRNELLSLNWLDEGFMTLSDEVVPVAYGESLFATRMLIQKYGFGAVTVYMSFLKQGSTPAAAFQTAFGESLSEFESSFQSKLYTWAISGRGL